MADELKIGIESGLTLIANVYQPDGSVRELSISMTETPASSGLYLGDSASIIAGDSIIVKSGSEIVGADTYQEAAAGTVTLAATGLDNIPITVPAGGPTKWHHYLTLVFEALWIKEWLTRTLLTRFKSDGAVRATRAVSNDGTTKKVEDPSWT